MATQLSGVELLYLGVYLQSGRSLKFDISATKRARAPRSITISTPIVCKHLQKTVDESPVCRYLWLILIDVYTISLPSHQIPLTLFFYFLSIIYFTDLLHSFVAMTLRYICQCFMLVCFLSSYVCVFNFFSFFGRQLDGL